MDRKLIKVPERVVERPEQPSYAYGFNQPKLESQAVRFWKFWKLQSINNNQTYFTKKPWFVFACTIAANSQTISWFMDWIWAGTKVAEAEVDWANPQVVQIMFPVSENSYYRVSWTSWIQFSYFTPLT
jgi:hypothetical protein